MWFGIEVPDNVWFSIEIIPILLALAAIVLCGSAIRANTTHRIPKALAVICGVLLILAQGGWITSHLNNLVHFKTLADNIWTIFNSLVMITFIMLCRGEK